MDEAIQRQLKRVCGIEVGIFEAERIKMMLGSALPFGKPLTTPVCGRDLTSGLPHRVEINDEIVRDALQEPIGAIIESVITALEQTKPEVAQDIISRGIYVAGGGALLKGLCERLQRETGIRFFRAQDPLSCVVRGVGRIVDNLKEMRELCIA
jgi:rod shape-determining protein MreB